MTADPTGNPTRNSLRRWVAGHRRQLRLALILAAVALVFFVIGALAPKVVMPYACKVYG